MAGMGPPPKPAHLRRRRNKDWSTTSARLPASGRQDPPPPWPLSKPSPAELEAWAELWRLPQAIAWEDMALARTVARYVRTLGEAENRGAPPSLLAETRQLEDRLGLSPMALLRLRWQIVDDDGADVAPAGPSSPQPAGDGRRLRVVDPKLVGGAGGA